jgi:hypothetical protein
MTDDHGVMVLDLTNYMIKGQGVLVNCWDQAGALAVMGRLVGLPACMKKLSPYGFLKPTSVVGITGACNNPAWTYLVANGFTGAKQRSTGDDSTLVTAGDERIAFAMHEFVECTTTSGETRTNRIYDSTVGPALGTQQFVDNYNSTHDDSSQAEDAEDSEEPYNGLTNDAVDEIK